MPITALPEATVRLLGSAQVLTTPTSLVKELVDNALDAKATSIDILISKNTLDKLEVRDNGHGIPTEDFDALGKRGHTSKLRSFEELRCLGGVTLGFRGEALASAVQLGMTSITTKTEGELVATKLVLKSSGGIHSQTSTSHPVGTTVTVSKFMAELPVRKNTFVKEAPRTLVKINQLLRSYAFARPFTRFSLKITDGSKGSWSFAPRPNDGIREAASQLIGRNAALECIEKSMVSELQSTNTSSSAGGQDTSEICPEINAQQSTKYGYFSIEAFLPKPDANPSKVGTGQYLSIDSRPVSFEKGTMKKVVTIFKKYIRGALADTSGNLKSPFIRLNITCPAASYDANVEPAKDDVLFENEDIVLELVERMLNDVYGECKTVPTASAPNRLAKKLDSFEVLLARNPAAPMCKLPPIPKAISLPLLSPGSSVTIVELRSPMAEGPAISEKRIAIEQVEDDDDQMSYRRRTLGVGISPIYSPESGDVERPDRPYKHIMPSQELTPEREASAAKLLNPWMIANLNAPSGGDHETMANKSNAFPGPTTDCLPSSQEGSQQPVRSSDSFLSPTIPPRQTLRSHDMRTSQTSVVNMNDHRPALRNTTGFEDELFVAAVDLSSQSKQRNEFVTPRNIPETSLMSPPSTQLANGLPRTREPNRPFASILRVGENRSARHRVVQTTLCTNSLPPRTKNGNGQTMPQTVSNPDLAWAMDFEQRKEDATHQRREELRAARLEVDVSKSSNFIRPFLYKGRYDAAIANLDVGQPGSYAPGQEKESFKSTLLEEHRRAYLAKRQKSFAEKTAECEDRPMLIRAKSAKLPLERIPQGEHLHSLVHNVPLDMESLRRVMTILEDMYVSHGVHLDGLIMNSSDVPSVARKLQEVVEAWIRTDVGKKYEIEYKFGDLLSPESLGP